MHRLALLILIAGGSAVGFSSLVPVYYPEGYTHQPSNVNVTTSPSPIMTTNNDSSIVVEKSKAVIEDVTSAAPIRGNDIAVETISKVISNNWDEFFFLKETLKGLIPFINKMTRYSAQVAIILMQTVTLTLVGTAFISMLCSYTSYCIATFEGLQLKEIPTYYKTIELIVDLIQEIFKRTNITQITTDTIN